MRGRRRRHGLGRACWRWARRIGSATTHPDGPSATVGTGQATVMVVAMMLPGCVPMIGHVRHRALRRRWWAAPTVLAAYLAVWVVAAVVAADTLPAGWSRRAVAGALAVAAIWQLTPLKRWAASACDRPVRLALRGAPRPGPRCASGSTRARHASWPAGS